MKRVLLVVAFIAGACGILLFAAILFFAAYGAARFAIDMAEAPEARRLSGLEPLCTLNLSTVEAEDGWRPLETARKHFIDADVRLQKAEKKIKHAGIFCDDGISTKVRPMGLWYWRDRK